MLESIAQVTHESLIYNRRLGSGIVAGSINSKMIDRGVAMVLTSGYMRKCQVRKDVSSGGGKNNDETVTLS